MEVLEDTICVRCAMEACMATSFDARFVARAGPRTARWAVCNFVCYFTYMYRNARGGGHGAASPATLISSKLSTGLRQMGQTLPVSCERR